MASKWPCPKVSSPASVTWLIGSIWHTDHSLLETPSSLGFRDTTLGSPASRTQSEEKAMENIFTKLKHQAICHCGYFKRKKYLVIWHLKFSGAWSHPFYCRYATSPSFRPPCFASFVVFLPCTTRGQAFIILYLNYTNCVALYLAISM